jgi:urease accessory protein
MLVADIYLGHEAESTVAERVAETTTEQVHRTVLTDTERRRSRVRTRTTDGLDLGVVVARDLGDGDVLETDGEDLVVVELEPVDAMVLDLADADVDAVAALELGHAVGNRHWDMVLRGSEALFPVPDTRDRMRATVEGLLPAGLSPRFECVPATTFDDDGHDHSHEHPHDHGHHHEEPLDLDVRSTGDPDG